MLPPFLYSWFYLTTILNNKNIQHIAWHFKVLNSLKNYSQYILIYLLHFTQLTIPAVKFTPDYIFHGILECVH